MSPPEKNGLLNIAATTTFYFLNHYAAEYRLPFNMVALDRSSREGIKTSRTSLNNVLERPEES
jgi:hypothetical protein